MPASTGIGIGPACDAVCSMDLVAAIEPVDSIEYLSTGGNQESAFDYGSAFSRATRISTPAGKTVYVSGTASIDAAGATTNLGDTQKQIEATIENVRAVLRDMDCSDKDIVQAIMFCKTAEIEKFFCDKWADLGWPIMTAITDVCRDDLLVEIEATAVKAG